MAKYGNRKITVNGITFDSLREYARWQELTWLQRAGHITDLERQVKFELIPAQRINGKLAERAVNYIADFVYKEKGQTVVEDAKGHKTKEYILKRKMMLYFHNIRIKEV